MFHQPTYNLCLTNKAQITLEECEITISYAEEHDEHTVEFHHKHPEYEIIYVIEGKISIILNKQEEQLSAGEFILLNKQVDHYIVYKPSVSNRYLNVIFSISPPAHGNTKNSSGKQEASVKTSRDLRSFFQCIPEHD